MYTHSVMIKCYLLQTPNLTASLRYDRTSTAEEAHGAQSITYKDVFHTFSSDCFCSLSCAFSADNCCNCLD